MPPNLERERIGALERARHLADDRDWTALAAMARADMEDSAGTAPELGYLLADALNRTGDPLGARHLLERVEPAIVRSGDRRLRLRTGNLTGVIAFESGDVATAEERFADLLDTATRWGDAEFAARASNNLGVIANIRGQRELALTYYERALAAYQRLGHRRGLAQTHYNLGISYRDLGRTREADDHYSRAIDLAASSASHDVVALARTERAELRIRSGDLRLAERWLRDAQDRFESLGDPVRRAEVLRVRAAAARAGGQHAAARTLLDEAADVAGQHGNLLLAAEVARDRGRILAEQGYIDGAISAFHVASDAFARLGAADAAAAARADADELARHDRD